MRDDEPKHPVNRREFLESTGRFAAALGWAGASLAPGCGPGEEPPAPARRPVVDTHMHVWANDPARYPFPHPYIPGFEYADVPAEATTEMLLEDMDRNGVDSQHPGAGDLPRLGQRLPGGQPQGPPGPLPGTWAHRSHRSQRSRPARILGQGAWLVGNAVQPHLLPRRQQGWAMVGSTIPTATSSGRGPGNWARSSTFLSPPNSSPSWKRWSAAIRR